MTPPYKPTPVDCLGYPSNCCHCIKLRTGNILICILSFLWAIVELQQSNAFIETIFPHKDTVTRIFKVFHIFVIIIFLVSCGVLMLGIIVRRSLPLHVYIWTAFIFNVVSMVLTLVSVAVQVISKGSIDKASSAKLGFAVFADCLFIYLITVVNSYKMTFWA